ncbi:MAG TPA: histidinol dehydrogenase [Candidatus Sulfotelmatobacter sp.]|nr:histidinol dehydrogenase [Candidatus Sulfotelmatobacter sp.]
MNPAIRALKAETPEARAFLERLRDRGRTPDPAVEAAVRSILAEVRGRGDAALVDLTERFDGWRATAGELRVPAAEIAAAGPALPAPVTAALGLAAERIDAFHRRQRRESWLTTEPGIGVLGQLVRPLRRVGLYVPGGAAAYPSSVLMNALPAKVAGVAEIAMCTPAGPDGRVPPAVLYAAKLAGVEEIYRLGGAQAIAALAFGTESVPAVDKIVGPGNLYVATAKRLVFGVVGIDLLAGPSEILALSDGTVPAAWVAADLLAQAEHDPLAAALCCTPSESHAAAVQEEVARQLRALPRREIAAKALEAFGAVLLVRDVRAGLELAAAIGPEHLELLVADPWAWVPELRNAGAVFLGGHSPEAAGDYLAGPNHVLPTAGAARFSSPLSVEDFQQRSSLLHLAPAALAAWREAITSLARLEGLEGHARSILSRTES